MASKRGAVDLVIGIGLMVGGCSNVGSPAPDAPVTIPAAAANYRGIAWLRDGSIVVSFGPADEVGFDRLKAVDRATGIATPIDVPLDAACSREDLHVPVALPNGGFAYLDRCLRGVVGPDSAAVVARDPSGSTSTITSLQLAGPAAGPFTVSPDSRRVAIGIGNQLCNSIALYEGSTRVLLDVTLSEDGREYRLDTVSDGTAPCGADAIVNWPAWSPDGGTIAFVASLAAMGVSGVDRAGRPFTIWALNLSTNQARPLLKGVLRARSLKWSWDGRLLAFSGSVDGQAGTWALDVATGIPRLIHPTVLENLAWAPDGRNIVGTVPDGLTRTSLVVIDVRAGS